jgi:hypothetical protein
MPFDLFPSSQPIVLFHSGIGQKSRIIEIDDIKIYLEQKDFFFV